jgi:phosphopantothenate-cysteine ligase
MLYASHIDGIDLWIICIVAAKYEAQTRNILQSYCNVMSQKQLIQFEFTTITEYLFLLRMCVQEMHLLGPKAMYYLAAAVSDFFIPKSQLVLHHFPERFPARITQIDCTLLIIIISGGT